MPPGYQPASDGLVHGEAYDIEVKLNGRLTAANQAFGQPGRSALSRDCVRHWTRRITGAARRGPNERFSGTVGSAVRSNELPAAGIAHQHVGVASIADQRFLVTILHGTGVQVMNDGYIAVDHDRQGI